MFVKFSFIFVSNSNVFSGNYGEIFLVISIEHSEGSYIDCVDNFFQDCVSQSSLIFLKLCSDVFAKRKAKYVHKLYKENWRKEM